MEKNSRISRREFVGSAIAGGLAINVVSAVDSSVNAAGRPNIIFILADDLGWGDLSCYGRPDYRTPNLDLLARQGTRFSNAYSGAPVCTPTRVAFQTGRYPGRLAVGLEEPIQNRKRLGERVKTIGIPLEHPTVSSLMKAAGYDTALIGKWHLGYLPEFGPKRHGFDEFFGILGGAGDFFTHKDMAGDADLYEGEVPVERAGYITDLLTDRAVAYISRPHENPFYLSLHYTAPHWPWEGPRDEKVSQPLKQGYEGFTAGGSPKIYAEMMESLDDGIGRVLKVLRSSRLERRTMIIFTSDNGGERFSYNWPFSGQKFELREGGVRVPAIVRWPGVVPAGRVLDQVAVTMDWTATILAAAGTKPDPKYPLDGKDLLKVITGKQELFERTLFWRINQQGAVRSGKWKYLTEGKNEYLFDLSVDEREQADFKEANPQMFIELRENWQKWNAQMLPYPKTGK